MSAQTMIQNARPPAPSAKSQPAAAAPSFGEAPASATVDAISPSGRRWLLTTRAATVGELMSRVEYLDKWLSDHEWTPSPSRSTGGPGTQQSEPDAPICPKHGAMKRGKRGWYCPHKIADDDGTGKPVYCKHTA